MGKSSSRSCFSSESCRSEMTCWTGHSAHRQCKRDSNGHMLDLACWEESEDALGTPELERAALVTAAEGAVRHCPDEAELDPLASCAACFRGNSSPWPEELQDHLQELLDREHEYMPQPDYLADHPHVKPTMRQELVRWMVAAATRYRFGLPTCSIAVNLLDRYLSQAQRSQVWEPWLTPLAAVTCLSIAAKLEEVNLPNNLSCLQVNVPWGSNFTANHIMEMELIVLQSLQWRLAAITAMSFSGPFLELLRHGHPPLQLFNTPPPPGTPGATPGRTPEAIIGSIRQQAKRLLYVCLSEDAFLQFRPSTIMCAAILQSMVPRCSHADVCAAAQMFSFITQVDECRQLIVQTLQPEPSALHSIPARQHRSSTSGGVETPQQQMDVRKQARGSVTPTHPRPTPGSDWES